MLARVHLRMSWSLRTPAAFPASLGWGKHGVPGTPWPGLSLSQPVFTPGSSYLLSEGEMWESRWNSFTWSGSQAVGVSLRTLSRSRPVLFSLF